jgi:2,4-dienoyl-CoA reductase-like NADH-dependent reductase (Old Yellow Enzyme family)
MSAIDDAVARLQDLSQAMTGVTIKAAPDYPTEAAPPAPFSLAYLADGEFWVLDASQLHIEPVVNVDFMFSRVNIKQMYQQADSVAVEFSRRLAADPTLNSKVTSMRLDREVHPTFTTQVVMYGQVEMFLLRFQVPLKILSTPL